MPGLNQLKKFASDVKVLGDEIKIRSERGEPLIQLSLPSDVSKDDDSEDFVFGLPVNQANSDNNENVLTENDDLITDEIDPDLERLLSGISEDLNGIQNKNTTEQFDPNILNMDDISDIPDLDSMPSLETLGDDFGLDLSDDKVLDLEDIKNTDLADNFLEHSSGDEFVIPESSSGNDFVIPESPAMDDFEKSAATRAEDLDFLQDIPEHSSGDEFVIPESSAMDDFEKSAATMAEDLDFLQDIPEHSSGDDFVVPESPSSDDFVIPESPSMDDFEKSAATRAEDLDFLQDIPEHSSGDEFVIPESPSGDEFVIPESPSGDDFVIPESSAMDDFEKSAATRAEDLDFLQDIPELDDIDFSSEGTSDILAKEPSFTDLQDFAKNTSTDNSENLEVFENVDISSINEESNNTDDIEELEEVSEFEFDEAINKDFSSNAEESFLAAADDFDSIFDNPTDTQTQTVSSMEDMDIHDLSDINPSNDNFEFPNDFSDFETSTIPNLTDDDFTSTASDHFDFSLDDFATTDGMLQDSNLTDDEFAAPDLDAIDNFDSSSSGYIGKSKEEKRTSLSDSEYVIFKKNLAEYPLNLRITIEEIIVKNEFTDDAVFGVIEKVLKKVSARQLATYIEKYLDISVDVPRDFERRTATQYEIYKQSLQYQLKNRIIPAMIVCVFVIVFIAVFSFLGNRFVYEPMAAEKNYKEGYELLQTDMYQQAEMKFNTGLSFKPKKKWFFKYAQGYIEKKQFDRAREKYEHLLRRFNNDKSAGLEYATMEFKGLENYSKAEEILKRKVLDYHINDKDAMLMLADVYLEWGTERDNTKLIMAFKKYNELIELYGYNDLYASRLMRYYIRTDKLKEVLPLKNYFFNKKNSLEADDLVELSGYLLEKLYGKMLPTEEYLRSQIQDVRALLEQALIADAMIPEAHYNMGKYFVYTDNPSSAISRLKVAKALYEEKNSRHKKDIYKYIDTYRLLGEEYTEFQEYIQAEEMYANGIELFEEEQKNSALKPILDIGKLYANLADINYFISNDFDIALYNYNKALSYGYDDSSVLYRSGFIQYTKGDFDKALDNFMKTIAQKNDDVNALFALANVFAIRDNQSMAQGYYKRLITILDNERSRYKILFPQVSPEHYDLVNMYMKTSNNLGVTLATMANRLGDNTKLSTSMVYLSEANRAYDALTRNPTTMKRLEGSNLAAQNMKYLVAERNGYKPALYTEIPRILRGEKMLQQDFVK